VNPHPAFLPAAAWLAGCAVQALPAEQLAASEAAIARAERAGAARYAATELNSAKEKLRLTHRWIEARDYAPARWLAEQAQVDAELAEVKARLRDSGAAR
jgi:hypothetical protein